MKSVLSIASLSALLLCGAARAQAPQVGQAQLDAQVQAALAKALLQLDLGAMVQRAANQAVAQAASPASAQRAQPAADCALESIDEAPRLRRSRSTEPLAELDPQTAAALKGLQTTALSSLLPLMQGMLTDTLPTMMKDMQADLRGTKR